MRAPREVETMRPESELPPELLREIAVAEFLPEVLHDLNNECAVLDGVSVLLRVGAKDPAKIQERALALAQTSEGVSRVSWASSAIVGALGGPSSPEPRDDALARFLEIVASVARRRGGSVDGAMREATVVRDPPAACAVALAARALSRAPGSVAEFVLEGADGSCFAWRVRRARSDCDVGAIGRHLEGTYGILLAVDDRDDERLARFEVTPAARARG